MNSLRRYLIALLVLVTLADTVLAAHMDALMANRLPVTMKMDSAMPCHDHQNSSRDGHQKMEKNSAMDCCDGDCNLCTLAMTLPSVVVATAVPRYIPIFSLFAELPLPAHQASLLRPPLFS